MYRFANKITQIILMSLRDKNFAEVCFTNIFVVSQTYLNIITPKVIKQAIYKSITLENVTN